MREQTLQNQAEKVDGNGEARERESAAPETVPSIQERHEMTLHEVISLLWEGRRTLAAFVGATLLCACIYLIGSRSEYTSGAMLMPEKVSEQGIGDLGLLNQFGGLLGQAIPSGLLNSTTSQIPPNLYPEIAKSTALQLALLRKEIYVPAKNRSMTVYQYLASHKPFSLWESLAKLPASIASFGDQTATEQAPVVADSSIIHLTRDQEAVVEDLRDRVTAEFDIPQGVVHVTVAMPDPQVSAQVAEAFVNELTNYVSTYRSDRQRRKTEFIQQLQEEAEVRFNNALTDLANFKDTHRNLARDLARAEEQRLQAEYDLSFSLYNSLSSRLDEARIQLQEQTPVFKILNPVSVPLRKSYPPTLVTLLLSAVLGFLTGSGYLLFRPALRDLHEIVRRR